MCGRKYTLLRVAEAHETLEEGVGSQSHPRRDLRAGQLSTACEPLRLYWRPHWPRSAQSLNSSFLCVPNPSQCRTTLTSSRGTSAAAVWLALRGRAPVSVGVISQVVSMQPCSFKSELPINSWARMPRGCQNDKVLRPCGVTH